MEVNCGGVQPEVVHHGIGYELGGGGRVKFYAIDSRILGVDKGW